MPREKVLMKSTATITKNGKEVPTGTTYTTDINKKKTTGRTGKLELMRYDRRVRKHVKFVQAKLPSSG